MSPRLLPIAIALLLATVIGVRAQAPEPGKAAPAKPPPMGDIVFYVAHGGADACGPGCREWIAAEGKIDAAAAQHLRRLLAKLGHRRPPIFFHSPGGQINGALELGRLMREQKLTVSVGRTIPRGCDRDKPVDKSCDAMKRSGQELEAEIDPDFALCASSCVYALAGGTVRVVPPWVKLGIHDVGFDPNNPPPRGAPIAEVKRLERERIQGYLREMGFDKELAAAAAAVPNETIRWIDRNDIVRFGIDRREFGESLWVFSDKPYLMASKRLFTRTPGGRDPVYRDLMLSLVCTGRSGIALALAQEHDASTKAAGWLPLVVHLNGQRFDLRNLPDVKGLDMGAAFLPASTLDSLDDDATIEISGTEEARDGAFSVPLLLAMDGFSAVYGKLRQRCAESVPAVATAMPGWNAPGNPGLPLRIEAPSQVLSAPSAASAAPRSPSSALAGAASPTTVEFARTVHAEQSLALDILQPNCWGGRRIEVIVVEEPQHGSLTIGNGQTTLCNPDGLAILYQPSPGYTGADSLAVKVSYPVGVSFSPGATFVRHYSIDVK
jgi:hypothetical protein